MALERSNVAGEAVSFPGSHGKLAGLLELPATPPRAFALFAHCFTCGKNSKAATRISRALAEQGIAVLRFDFTGLGGSDGDFAHTDFSSNIDDLVAAADYLRREHAAPELLIGHSLGGTAVLAAAERVAESRAVITIAAPATPAHVIAHFGADRERIEREGVGEVSLGGRTFRISKSFFDDIEGFDMETRIRKLRRALLVMHSPVDKVVEIDEAGRIFTAALHPKSFVSLDDADHLLTDERDADYVARTVVGWSSRYLDTDGAADVEPAAAGQVRVGELNTRFLRQVASDDHHWLADEPQRNGGDNLGPDPYEHLLAALGACTSMTLRLYANRKQWPLAGLEVSVGHSREHADDCENCDEAETRIEVLQSRIRLDGELTAEQRERLIEIAGRCPVHRTLSGRLRIDTEAVG